MFRDRREIRFELCGDFCAPQNEFRKRRRNASGRKAFLRQACQNGNGDNLQSRIVAAPGDGQLLAKNADGSWTLTSGETIAAYGVANGATGIAALTSVESTGAAAGNGKLTYAYSIADPSKVASVTDGAGRSLTFTWSALSPAGCAAAIVCVSGPDGVSWRYVGDASGGTGGKLLRERTFYSNYSRITGVTQVGR